MGITDQELDERRKRNAAAEEQLREIQDERAREQAEALNEMTALHLDAEYERTQAAIAAALEMNKQSSNADQAELTAALNAPVPSIAISQPKPENTDTEKEE